MPSPSGRRSLLLFLLLLCPHLRLLAAPLRLPRERPRGPALHPSCHPSLSLCLAHCQWPAPEGCPGTAGGGCRGWTGTQSFVRIRSAPSLPARWTDQLFPEGDVRGLRRCRWPSRPRRCGSIACATGRTGGYRHAWSRQPSVEQFPIVEGSGACGRPGARLSLPPIAGGQTPHHRSRFPRGA